MLDRSRTVALVVTLLLCAAVAWTQEAQELEVRIVAPEESSYVSGPTTIRAEVTPGAGASVVRVTFFVDDEQIGERTEEPWEIQWDAGADFRRRLIRVEAEDSTGATVEDTALTRDLETAVFRAEVARVLLYVTVEEDNGALIPGLEAEDFEVYEDGREQEIVSFTSDPRPMVVGLLVDTSGSMEGPKMERAKQGALAFLGQMGTADEAFVMSFDAFPNVRQELTSNRRLLREAILEMQPQGATSLNLAIVDASDILAERAERRALVILSDGFDTVQTVSERQAVEYAQRQDVRVYTIGIFDTFRGAPRNRGFDNVNRGEVTLRAFSDGTGGRAIILQSLGELENAYAEIAAELRSQYAIAYRPDDPAERGEYREIEVRASEGNARTKPGYYGR